MSIVAKSVFRRGAEDGVWFGIYLSVLFVLSILQIPFLGLLGLIMALAVPVYVFFVLRKGYIENGCFYTFSEMWTYGIILFLCGSLFMASTIIIYLNWINPSFIYDQCLLAIELYRQIGGPTGYEMASTLEKMVNNNMLPTPFTIASNLITFSVFSGSILSIILSLIIRKTVKSKDI